MRGADGFWDLTIDVGPGEMAGVVTLQRSVVLLETGDEPGEFAATKPGSILWEERPLAMPLEGSAARFPTEVVSFKSLGRGTLFFVNAPWFLQLTYEDPGDNFRRGVRLLVNSDHPVAAVLASPTHPRFGEVTTLIQTDIVQTLISALASEADALDLYDDDDESVAALAGEMALNVMGIELHEAIRMCLTKPAEFVARLRSHTGFLKEVGKK